MQEIKGFQIRMPKDVWMFLKKDAYEQESSMAKIIIEVLYKYKDKHEARLEKKLQKKLTKE